MSYWGDYPLGETLNKLFTTRAFATGIPTVLSGSPVLSVYEDTNLTQITAGVTVTVDHDGVVGLNRANVVATSGNGYESGKSYSVVITTGTVGGVSVVGEVVGMFTVDRGAAMRPTVAGRTLDVTATGAAGIDWGNVENPTTTVDLSATDIQLADSVTTVTTLTNLPSIPANWLTAAGTAADFGLEIADAIWDEDATGHQTLGTFGQAIGDPVANTESIYDAVVTDAAGTNIAADIIVIESQTDDIGVAGAGLTAINLPNQTMDITGNITGNLSGSVGSLTGHTPQTGDSFARLGAPAAASVSADILAIDNFVDGIEATLGTPTDFGSGTSTLAANLQDMADDGTAVFDRSTDSLQAIRDQGDAAWTTGGAGSGLTPLDSGTLRAGGTSTQALLPTARTFADDILNGNVIKLLTGTGAGQSRVIPDYTSSTDTATVSPAWVTNPDATTTYEVVNASVNIATVSNVAEDIATETNIGTAGAGLTAINLPNQTMDIVGNITGNLSGSVGSLTGHTPQTGDNFARLGAPAGASVSADIAVIESQTDDIGVAGAGLTAINLPNQTMDIVGDITGNLSGSVGSLTGHTPQTGDNFVRLGAPAGASVSADIAVIEAQTDDIGVAGAGLTAINLPNQTMDITGNITGNLSGSVGSVTATVDANLVEMLGVAQSATDLTDFADAGYDPATNKVNGVVLVDTTTANTDMRGTDSATLASVITLAAINAEVVDVMDTDTITLPGQEAPPLTPTRTEMAAWLFKTFRNRTDQTATLWQLYADNETTVDSKAPVSDDATTAIKQEVVSGP